MSCQHHSTIILVPGCWLQHSTAREHSSAPVVAVVVAHPARLALILRHRFGVAHGRLLVQGEGAAQRAHYRLHSTTRQPPVVRGCRAQGAIQFRMHRAHCWDCAHVHKREERCWLRRGGGVRPRAACRACIPWGGTMPCTPPCCDGVRCCARSDIAWRMHNHPSVPPAPPRCCPRTVPTQVSPLPSNQLAKHPRPARRHQPMLAGCPGTAPR